MAQEKIIVTIPKDGGTIKVEAVGYTGQACSLSVQDVVKAIGGEQVSEELKPEFYAPPGKVRGEQVRQ